jgi:hypothetical protein
MKNEVLDHLSNDLHLSALSEFKQSRFLRNAPRLDESKSGLFKFVRRERVTNGIVRRGSNELSRCMEGEASFLREKGSWFPSDTTSKEGVI